MFERYTEKARRVIFFARYEASHYGSGAIETEHLLLGLVREDLRIVLLLPGASYESVRQQIDVRTATRETIPTSVDIPLSNQSRRVLKFAAEEARGLNHHHIGTEHLLLGLLREKNCFGAQILQQGGAELAKLRRQIEKLPERPWPAVSKYELRGRNVSAAFKDTIEIHGAPWNTEYVHDAYKKCREYNWHWQKAPWTPHDLIINRKEATISFDLRLADDAENFHLVKGGWKKDHCTICRWELFASPDSPAHGVGYTNGRDWLCAECYEKFFAQNFFFSAYPDIT
jgi:hypothetical protein